MVKPGVQAAGDQVALDEDVIGAAPGVFGRDLDPDVTAGDMVVADDDVGAAVDVDAVRAVAPPVPLPVGGIPLRAHASDGVVGDQPVTGAIGVGIAIRPGQRGLESDRVDADVVHVVDVVADDGPVGDVAVHHDGLAGTQPQPVDRVRADGQIRDRSVRIVAVHGDAMGVDVEAAQRRVVVAQVVHVIADDADALVVTVYVDPGRHHAAVRGAVAGDVQSANGDP